MQHPDAAIHQDAAISGAAHAMDTSYTQTMQTTEKLKEWGRNHHGTLLNAGDVGRDIQHMDVVKRREPNHRGIAVS